MGIFNKLFGKKTTSNSPSQDEQSKFMPKTKIPVDELFATNFIANGGKFLYSVTLDSVLENFQAILQENNWDAKNVLCYNDALKNKFKQFNFTYPENNSNPSFFLTGCESLIADKGSVLISSNQIKEQKIDTLPNNFVLFATTSQLKESIGDGLKSINKNNFNQIPSNITTLKCFKISEEKDFLTYGSNSKNLYLLLLEDL